MKRMLAALLVLLALYLPLSPAFAQEENTAPITATVKCEEGAPVYGMPCVKEEPEATIADGERVSVTQLGLSMCRIAVAGGEGYIPSKYLTFAAVSDSETFCVVGAKSSGKLTLREDETTQSKSLGVFPNGTVAITLKTGDVFTYVYAGGKVGYLLTKHLTFFSAREPAQGLVMIYNPKDEDKPINVKLRLQAQKNGLEAGEHPTGLILAALEQGETWCEVEFNGLHGYMMTQYLREQDSFEAAEPEPTTEPKPTATPEPVKTGEGVDWQRDT